MKIEKLIYEDDWHLSTPGEALQAPQLVLFFGGSRELADPSRYDELRRRYPEAHLVGCSTAGEILDDEVLDDSVVATALEFEGVKVAVHSIDIDECADSHAAGVALGRALDREDLRGLLILSDGQKVNGSELVRGIAGSVSAEVPITGGLAGDADRFETTLVSCDAPPRSGLIAGVGFYCERADIGFGSFGGWDSFGPTRTITRAESNVLFELDGRPALALYKEYLGDEAENLPGSALLFPLSIYPEGQPDRQLVRTILSIDEDAQSMTFAGDLPVGHSAQLMMANFDRLVEGASEAARRVEPGEDPSDRLAILISCVGRKIVLGQRTADEVEAVQERLGEGAHQVGFYSYGEISPNGSISSCELHNQTMTITVLSER
ncbi:MAG: FIST N-terminal domain-containing protein [Acidobacteriota bacterium]